MEQTKKSKHSKQTYRNDRLNFRRLFTSLRTGRSHRDVEVGSGEVVLSLEFASIEVQTVTDEAKEREEEEEEDEVAGEVYQVGPPARGAFDVHF